MLNDPGPESPQLAWRFCQVAAQNGNFADNEWAWGREDDVLNGYKSWRYTVHIHDPTSGQLSKPC